MSKRRLHLVLQAGSSALDTDSAERSEGDIEMSKRRLHLVLQAGSASLHTDSAERYLF